MSIFEKIKNGLNKTRTSFLSSIDRTLAAFGKVDEDLFEQLEEVLIMGDVGYETTTQIIDELKKVVAEKRIVNPIEIKGELKTVITDVITKPTSNLLEVGSNKKVILVIGVNGVGKTTSIGKMAYSFKERNKRVILAAADTFRAAAIDQLEIWAERVGCDIVKHEEGSDPGAVVFDALQASRSRNADVVICDTAGRLHNKKNLMDELSKIARIVLREMPDADLETLLVLDASTGQNALSQAKAFSEVAQITGLVLTKLDGTAKGGIAIRISSEMEIPIKLIGVGEAVDDLQEFDASDFVNALLD